MFTTTQMKLKTKSILNIPLNSYENFSFIVKGKEFKTTRIISDLLSKKICQIHSCDPTFTEFIINTQNKGDFSIILKLVNFQLNVIPENEVPFVSEVFQILENDYIEVDKQISEITEFNVIDLIEKHQKFPIFFRDSLFDEINFISMNFYKILAHNEEDLKRIDLNILERIVNNRNLVVKDENQLLDFVNRFYSSDSKYSPLYEYILFQNVELTSINEFLNIFDISDLTSQTWKAVSNRLKQKVDQFNVKMNRSKSKRYVEVSIIFFYQVLNDILMKF